MNKSKPLADNGPGVNTVHVRLPETHNIMRVWNEDLFFMLELRFIWYVLEKLDFIYFLMLCIISFQFLMLFYLTMYQM